MVESKIMLKKFLVYLYNRGTLGKYVTTVGISIIIMFLCHWYLETKILWMLLVPVYLMVSRLIYLVFIKDEVIKNENMSRKKYRIEVIGIIIGIILLTIFFYFYIPYYYRAYV